MYDQMKNELLATLSTTFTTEQLQLIGIALDKTCINYDVSKKSTDLVVYGCEVPDLVKTYIVCKKIEGLSDATLYNYTTHLNNFFLAIRKTPADVTSNDIRVYLFQYQEHKHVSNRSLDKIRQCISSFFSWCQNEGYISSNPAIKIPKLKYEVTPRCELTQIELEQLRNSCKTKRETAIIELLYSTGCRVSELSKLKISDIDFNTKKVHLFGKGNKHRDSFLNAKAEIAVRSYMEQRSDDCEYVIVSDRGPHGQLSTLSIQQIVKKIASRTSLTKHITPHVFRHTTATTALQNGMPVESVQQLLGHSNINTTMIYAHADLDNLQHQHLRTVI